jgi:hypothetical protein
MKQKQYDIQTTHYCDGINGVQYPNETRDINNEQTYLFLQVYNFMTKNIITLDSSMTLHSLETTLSIAKELMLERKIEKIPIVNNGILVGLITLNNIKHYENNKSKACIDLNGALCVGAAIGIVDDYMERLEQLVNAGADLICIDVANGFNENVFKSIILIREKYKEIVLMVGNVYLRSPYAYGGYGDYTIGPNYGIGNSLSDSSSTYTIFLQGMNSGNFGGSSYTASSSTPSIMHYAVKGPGSWTTSDTPQYTMQIGPVYGGTYWGKMTVIYYFIK